MTRTCAAGIALAAMLSAGVAASAAVAPPPNLLVGFSGLGGAETLGGAAYPRVSITPGGANARAGQGQILIDTGLFDAAYGVTPGTLTRGYVEFEPGGFRTTPGNAHGHPICSYEWDWFAATKDGALGFDDPAVRATTTPAVFASHYFQDNVGAWHVGVFFALVGYAQPTRLTLDFVCPPN
jgi:hypothetical protein